jgi:hypothetical protein
MLNLYLIKMLPTFPQFVELTIDDKEKYNALVAEYPPFSDLAFTTLHIWWNLSSELAISSLNDNLIINYSLPFDRSSSGYSLIGKNILDDSIQTIFDYLRTYGKPTRLVHVPEFVIEKISHKENLNIEEEVDYHEYIMASQQLANLEGSTHSRIRRKVNRFLREVEGKKLEIKSLDLSSPEVKDLWRDSISHWQKKYPNANDPQDSEGQALEATLKHSSQLSTLNLCLFVDGELFGVILYHLSVDRKHFIINHFRVNYDIPFIFDYMTNQIAERAIKEAVPFINMEMDLGIEGLRQHKMGLRPVHFFKKFTITPN